MIPRAHGGHLVERMVSAKERDRRDSELRDLFQIVPFIDHVYDAEKIGLGAYSPLDGFMNRSTYESILDSGRLPDGLPWPIPIVLTPTGDSNAETIRQARAGDDIALLDSDRNFFALLHLEEKFPFDRVRTAKVVYGVTDPKHPNVADLLATGDTALSGRLELLRRLRLPNDRFEHTPRETREEFARRGWKNVAAYQTRNVPHLAHEYLHRCTLERADTDGLFIHPVVGRLKKGDYKPEVILETYEKLVTNYPPHRVMLASLTVTMRYAGPKGALFFAIVRKNYGCGQYIVGRDQAGVGNYYDPFACHRIFDEFPIDVEPILYQETFYCSQCGWMASPKSCGHPESSRVDTSQTRIRAALTGGAPLPREILRPEIVAVLQRGDVLLKE